MLEIVDINLIPRFSICAVALDMPDGSICRLRDEIYIISSLSVAKTYRFREAKISSNRRLHIDKSKVSSKSYTDFIINTYRIPNPFGFVIDVFIDIGVKQSR